MAHYPELLAQRSKQRKRDVLKQQWQHSQQLLASGQKALLSHVPHVPHPPALAMPHYPSSLSLASLSSWWQGGSSGRRRRRKAAQRREDGEAALEEEEEAEEEGCVEGEEGVAEAGRRQHRYAPREEPRDVRAHKSLRRWVVALLIFYGLLMLMSLPGSRRRFQERLRRGGGSMRALALQRSRHEWDLYLRRTVSHSSSMAALGRR